MNRTIKFRGKSKKTGEWLYGNLVKNGIDEYAIIPLCMESFQEHKVDKDTIGQLVVRFRNIGEEPLEIYTDDVLDIWDTEDDEVPHCLSIVDEHGIVTWKQERWFTIDNLDYCGFDFKVIGNVYDNPDLKDKAV